MQNNPTIHIAYADERNLVRKIIAEYISQLDQRFKVVIEASNGTDLLAQIGRSVFQPDVCILDICMPLMNGYETVMKIRKKYPFIKCLALADLDIEYSVHYVIQSGALGFVTKNADPNDIRNGIIEVYNNNYYFSGDILKKNPKIASKDHRELYDELLTDREIEFLSYCCSDMSYCEIADQMHLSCRTVENYCIRLRNKLNIESRIGLAMFASRSGFGGFSFPK